MNRKLSLLSVLFLIAAIPVQAQFVLSAVGGLSITPRVGIHGFETDGVGYEPELSYGLTVGYGLTERIGVSVASDFGSVDGNPMFHTDATVRFTHRDVQSAWRPYLGLGVGYLSIDVGAATLDSVGPKLELGTAYFVTPSIAVDLGLQVTSIDVDREAGAPIIFRDSQNLRSGRLMVGVSFYVN
ncbi:MAG: outer membrane beta-barrel protein [Bacteroidota bacterium]